MGGINLTRGLTTRRTTHTVTSRRRLLSLLATVFVSTASILGLTGVMASAAPPGGLNFWVATTGSDAGNLCRTQSFPCRTIGAAVLEEGLVGDGGTIHVARGTYTEQITLTPANSSVKILGVNAKKTIIEPPTGLSPSAFQDPNGTEFPYYVVQVVNGASNVTLENLGINGANAEGTLSSSSCGQQYAGIYYNDASGAISNVSVTGVDMPGTPTSPPGAFGCPGEGLGVYVVSDNTTPTVNVAMSGVSMVTNACTTTTTVPLPSGDVLSSATVPVKRLPKGKTCKGWNAGYVLIDGALFNAVAFGSHNLQVTGTTPYAIPAGSTVNVANPFTPAYGADGIVCANAHTSCSISKSTLKGSGPTDLLSQTGIEVLSASAVVSDNTVSGNSFTGGGAGAQGMGIRALDDGTVDVSGNTLSANDEGINAAWVPSLASALYPVTPNATVMTVNDAQTVTDQSTLTSPSGPFLPADVGRSVTLTQNASSALAAGSIGANLPQPVINVTSTSGFQIPGTILVPVSPSGTTPVACTGTTATSFTGCTGGVGTTAAGNVTETYGLSLGYVAQYVSAQVEVLSQPAPVGGSGEQVMLGVLPGTWDINGNKATSNVASGTSIGRVGYGDGIVLDSTDSCSSDPNENADAVVEGNTASSNSASGILAMGVSCATIGVTGNANTATLNDVGLTISAPGSACSPCTVPTQLGYESSGNVTSGNTFSGNNIGVLTSGITEPTTQTFGGPPAIGPGTTGNLFNGNTWQTNAVANAVDFNAWGGASCASCTDTLSPPGIVPPPPGSTITSVGLATAVSLPEGSIVQVVQSGSPTLNLIATAPVASGFVVSVAAFVPTTTYGFATSAVHINPFSPSNPTATNTWGTVTTNSCNPTAGGSASFQGITFNASYRAC